MASPASLRNLADLVLFGTIVGLSVQITTTNLGWSGIGEQTAVAA